jgi:hypothetical protein
MKYRDRRAVIRFLGAEGVKPADIHRIILAQYCGVNCTNQRKVFEWVETLKSGRAGVTDEGLSGRHHIEHAKALSFEKTDGKVCLKLLSFIHQTNCSLLL